MSPWVDVVLREIRDLPADDLIRVHREVSRLVAPIYAQRSEAKQRANFRTAMSVRDTRFQKGEPRYQAIKRLHAREP